MQKKIQKNQIPIQQINSQQQQQMNFQLPPQMNCQQQLQQQQTNFQSQPLIRMNKPQNSSDKLVAIIVTFCHGSSYDSLFSSVQQKTVKGTRVDVYCCVSNYLSALLKAFQGHAESKIEKQLVESVGSVDADCVVFNWQCSSGYSSSPFPEGMETMNKFLVMLLKRGHMAMYSDFSLKALIASWDKWDKSFLGPNPFVKTHQTSQTFQIHFRAAQLRQCPSAQLQVVGSIADGGKCNVNTMGGTIVYSVKKDNLNHDKYVVKPLTVVTSIKAPSKNLTCEIDEFKGTAGHILLKYPTKGMILTSMGHWAELLHIDTTEKKLFEMAEKQYGILETQKMKKQYKGMNKLAQGNYLKNNSLQMVQNQAPCSNMNFKS